MACHTVNMAYMGLDLRNPTTVVATTSGHNKDSYPKWSKITFEFPANTWRPRPQAGLVRRRQAAAGRPASRENRWKARVAW